MKLTYLKDAIFSTYIKLIAEKDTTSPIFIIGSGRCGSTLLSSMLNCHPNIFIPKENSLTIKLLKNWLVSSNLTEEAKKTIIKNAIGEQYNWSDNADDLLKRVERLPPNELSFVKCINLIFQQTAYETGKSDIRWGDQTVSNSNYILSFKSQFPNSKVIYLTRDPRSVAASYFKINKDYYTMKSVINRWETAFEKYEYLKKKHPVDIYMVKYNDLVSESDKTISALINWLEEESALLDLGKRKKNANQLIEPQSTHHYNLTNSINTKSIDKWRDTLTSYEIKHIEDKLMSKYESLC